MGISSISFPIILLKLVPPLFTGVMSCCNLQHAVDIMIMIAIRILLSIALLRYFREKQCPSGPVRLAGPSTWLSELTSGMWQVSLSFTVPVISLSLFWHLVTSQVCDKVTLKWTPNSLMDGRQGEEEVRIAILSLGMMMGKVDSVNDDWHGWFWFELLTFLGFPSAPGRWRMLAASCCHIHQVNSLLALPPGVLTLLSRSDKNDIKIC